MIEHRQPRKDSFGTETAFGQPGSTDAMPLVSILIPTYKSSRYIRRTLESCLAQSYPRLEIIAVDDRSPDNTLAILEEYAARYPQICVFARQSNGGSAEAFQTALDHSTGVYITRLAHDDLFYPDAVATLAQGLSEHPEIGLVYGDMVQIDEDDRILYPMITEEPDQALMPRNRVGLYTMWRKTVHDKVGGFLGPPYAEDYDLWLRISLHFKLMKVHAEPQLGFRLHATQMSQNHGRVTGATMRAQLRYLQALAKRQPLSPELWFKVLKGHLRYHLHAVGVEW